MCMVSSASLCPGFSDRCCRVDHCDSLILVQSAWIVGMQRIGIGGTVLLAPLDFKGMIPPCVWSHLLADGFEPWCYACIEAGNGRWQVPDIRPWQWSRTEEQSMTLTGKVLECFSFHIVIMKSHPNGFFWEQWSCRCEASRKTPQGFGHLRNSCPWNDSDTRSEQFTKLFVGCMMYKFLGHLHLKNLLQY